MEVGSVVMNCRNVNALLKKKLYQQFRPKKPGGAGVKLFSGYISRESRPRRHAGHAADGGEGIEFCLEMLYNKKWSVVMGESDEIEMNEEC